MNIVFLSIVLIAFAVAGWRELAGLPAPGQLPPMEALSRAIIESAAGAVDLALGLVGVMTLFLGLMKVRLDPLSPQSFHWYSPEVFAERQSVLTCVQNDPDERTLLGDIFFKPAHMFCVILADHRAGFDFDSYKTSSGAFDQEIDFAFLAIAVMKESIIVYLCFYQSS